MKYIAYLGTDSVRGSQGIYTMALDTETGTLTELAATPAMNAGYLCLSPDGKTLFAAIESMFLDGKATGGVAAYRIGPDGVPAFQNKQYTAGQLICHVSCDEQYLYASSYLNGTVSVFALEPDGSVGEIKTVIGHHGKDGYAPHIHCARPTADGKYLCVVEVGYHALCLYDRLTFEKVFEVRTKPVRPRQVVCADKKIYLLTEGGMTLDVYGYKPEAEEKLVLEQSISCNPEGFRGMGGAGGVRLSPDGRTLFTTIRGVDVLTVFAVNEDGSVEKKSVTKVCGSTPRDFNVAPDGRHLIVGLQKDDKAAVYRYDPETYTVELTQDGVPVPSVSGVEFGGEKA